MQLIFTKGSRRCVNCWRKSACKGKKLEKNLDQIDRKIISALQRNGRLRMAELSEEVGLSATPCARRVAQLEEAGFLQGYSARVDQAAVGFPVTIFVMVELERQSRDTLKEFEAAIRTLEQVMECHLLTGSRDILLRVVAASLSDFDRFLEEELMRVPGIRNMRSSFTLRTMVQRQELPLRA